MTQSINGFFGEHRFLSNFWHAEFELRGLTFPTAEHCYQAAKTIDLVSLSRVMRASSPAAAKRIGQQIRIRPDWDQVKLDFMGQILRAKFALPHLAERLRATGDAHLEETNTWGDTYWGVCNGRGENHLGRLLMEIRKEIS